MLERMSAATLMVARPTASSSRLLADVGEVPGYGGGGHGRPLDRLAAALGSDFADRLVAALSSAALDRLEAALTREFADRIAELARERGEIR
jgi:hypothetical protein